jgi:hypothetical protein
LFGIQTCSDDLAIQERPIIHHKKGIKLAGGALKTRNITLIQSSAGIVVKVVSLPSQNNTGVSKIRVRFGGDLDLRALGLPPGYNKIGKEENYYYSMSTGNRLSYSRAFINEDGTIDTATSFSERWAWLDSPGQETLDSLEIGLEELDFYIQLFSRNSG